MFQRNITPYALDLLAQYPVLAIVGARQVGKTNLSKIIAPNFKYFDLERHSDFDRIAYDPELFFKQYPSHVIFDEAQLYPALFPLLRSIVDSNRTEYGRFIITGSSSPELLSAISESLAGRVAIIELGTLKANEFYSQPLSDFYHIFHAPLNKNNIAIHSRPLNLTQIQTCWFQGGYPEPISRNADFYQEWMVDYQSTYLNRDIAQLFPKLDKTSYRILLTMLSKLPNRLINKNDLARAVGVSEPTISHYLEIAAGTFLWRKLPSFEKNIIKSAVKTPKGYIRDSGLMHHLLHIDSLESLQMHPDCGFSFEAFVIEEILKGLQDARVRNVDVNFYRTRSGAEIDLILEGAFGLLPIEIKYASRIARQQLTALIRFIEDHDCAFGILINQGNEIEWITDKIIQIPVGYL